MFGIYIYIFVNIYTYMYIYMFFGVNTHSIVAWMSRIYFVETGAISEV